MQYESLNHGLSGFGNLDFIESSLHVVGLLKHRVLAGERNDSFFCFNHLLFSSAKNRSSKQGTSACDCDSLFNDVYGISSSGKRLHSTYNHNFT